MTLLAECMDLDIFAETVSDTRPMREIGSFSQGIGTCFEYSLKSYYWGRYDDVHIKFMCFAHSSDDE